MAAPHVGRSAVKGEDLGGEAPIAWVQCARSRGKAIVCAECGRFLGGGLHQLALLSQLAGTAVEALGEANPLIQETKSGVPPDALLDSNMWMEHMACPLGCGELFCGMRCQSKALSGPHGLLCVGPHTEDHPLYQLRVAAFGSGAYDEFLLAARLAVSTVWADAPAKHSREMWRGYGPWWELVPPDVEEEEAASWKVTARGIVMQTWQLLEAGLGAEVWAAASPAWAAEEWGRLLAFVAAHGTPVARLGPATELCQRLWLAGGAPVVQRREVGAALLRCRLAVKGAEEEDGSEVDEMDVETNSAGDARNLTDRQLLSQILANPTQYLPKFETVGLYPSTLRLPHSCSPTAALLPAGGAEGDRGAEVRLCAVHDLRPDHPLTLSRIPTDGSLEDRRQQMAQIGLATCECARCRFESGDEAGVSLEDLQQLSAAAQAHERYDDALAVLAELLRRNPRDGDALFAKARVLGWSDRWSEAHRCLVAAAEAAPDHAGLQTAVRESAAYFQGVGPAHASLPQVQVVEGLPGHAFVCPELLDAAACAAVVAEAEEASARRGGWTTQRHYAVPTTDIPLHALPASLAWLNAMLATAVFPLLGRQFRVPADGIRVIDAFLVKYCAGAQRFLPLHADQSQFSLTIAMNPIADYSGGGTYFADLGEAVDQRSPQTTYCSDPLPRPHRPLSLKSVLSISPPAVPPCLAILCKCHAVEAFEGNCDVGGVIGFDGSLYHGGHPVTAGVRYIIVAFLYCDDGQ